MRIITEKKLRDYATNNARSRVSIENWIAEARVATWQNPAEIQAQHRTASVLPNNRIVFNIGGNTYRLVCGLHYGGQVVYIRFIGTHAEYDKIDAETV